MTASMLAFLVININVFAVPSESSSTSVFQHKEIGQKVHSIATTSVNCYEHATEQKGLFPSGNRKSSSASWGNQDCAKKMIRLFTWLVVIALRD